MNQSTIGNPGGRSKTLAIDGILGIALVVVLAIVYGLDGGTPRPEQTASEPVTEKTIEDEPETPQEVEQPRRLAVTTPAYDDMGKLLDSLGGGYQYTTIELDELLDRTKLDQYDVLFVTCSGLPAAWFDKFLGESERQGLSKGELRPEVLERIRDNLRQFVERGGTLYASDLIFGLVSLAFEEFVDRTHLAIGKEQTVNAVAVDPDLENVVGSRIDLRFDMNGWRPASFRGKGVAVLLEGSYETVDGEQAVAPLLVKFPVKEGTVIFTSFHNEKLENVELELKLLRYLVFATVLARSEAKVTKTLVEGGFSPAARNLLSATAGDPSVTRTYHCKKSGPLRFALGFESGRATLRLTVVGPAGKKLEREGTSSLSIDVPDAETGEWKYTITALKIPYENFPYALTIGEK